MKPCLLQIGGFPSFIQEMIDAEFDCVQWEDIAGDAPRRAQVRGIVTRSNFLIEAERVRQLPELGIIATCGVGYDGIPLALAREKGILVANTPDVLNAAVAELTIGLLLGLLRRLPQADRFLRASHWLEGAFPLGTSLEGKRVGIIGMGRIGKEIARRLVPFNVALAYHGRRDQGLATRFEPDLRALAQASDILIVAAPGGAQTAGMVDAEVLDALGPQGVIVNIARGSIIDEQALLAALSEGRIGGAALDVFHDEPRVDARLMGLDNVVLTPHIGSATHETRRRMAELTLENLRLYFREGRVLTPVSLPEQSG